MTADALKKITTDALDTLAALLDEGHSDQLTALLKTMARFHKYSWHNVCLLCRARHNRHHADCRIMPMTTWPSSMGLSFSRADDVGSLVNAA